MKQYLLASLLSALSVCSVVHGCSTDNKAASYTDETDEEKAKKALDAKDFPKAIELYKALFVAEPERYDLMPFLSVAYAGNAGVDIINLMKQQFDAASSGGNSDMFSMLGSFLPTDPTDDQLADIQLAIDTLEAMPEEHRTAGTYDYSEAAATQLSLFLAASSVMLINKVSGLGTGTLDPDRLANMTDAEADAIFATLGDVVANGKTPSGEAIGGAAQSTLDAIEAQEGATTREKITNYLHNR